MHNADVLFKEDSTVDDLIDVIEVRHRAGLSACQQIAHSMSATKLKPAGAVCQIPLALLFCH